jgi:primosomal protein N'
MNIVRVALDLPLPRLFDYLAPDSVESDIGRRVTVPFGNGSRTGVIVELAATSEQPLDKLKAVTEILRDMPALPTEWLALCEFCARYYQTPLGEVTSFALPPMLRRGKLPRMKKPPKIDVPPSATARRASLARPPCSAGASSAPTSEDAGPRWPIRSHRLVALCWPAHRREA